MDTVTFRNLSGKYGKNLQGWESPPSIHQGRVLLHHCLNTHEAEKILAQLYDWQFVPYRFEFTNENGVGKLTIFNTRGASKHFTIK